ncbi:hypothetical protein Petty_10 [Acinetobacter phage Petty]|uniref:Uncharacterized protein n=1 Tax=Acinetobacter phage Petty TaxID=1406779 RepID=U5PZF1_9CAUD|nr:hypothetical protein Petty_10 [Acinetobacter phage Petty]AGY47982.1 hypothetical protein Petty_10 [Acinetobacter phage Petty]
MKYPNVLINVFGAAHLQAVINEGERAGYTAEQSDLAYFLEGDFKSKCVHFQEDGTFYVYTGFTAQELHKHSHSRYKGSIVIKQTRQLRKALYNTVASRDNLSTLCVRTREWCYKCAVPPHKHYAPKAQQVINVQPDAPIVWERPKTENTLVNKFLVLCAVACIKVKQAVNKIVKHLK